ncbi:hypothetical protein LLE87_31765, partial [Paenibacillus polymyxa]|nr:hypothetical protein [Paenibacillus polymyxa]
MPPSGGLKFIGDILFFSSEEFPMHRPFRYTLLASSLWFSCGALAQQAGDLPLMPLPQQVDVTQPAGKLILDHRRSLS